jgi:exodeoxyribonuclease VII large subunit
MLNRLSSPLPAVITVTELNREARNLLEGSFPVLWVAGEISNFKRYDSGHCYFSLKDGGAQVRCVMFRNRAALIDFVPREGLQVEARAVVSLYEARGDFQLTVEALRPAGLGALFEAFEKLKRKLEAEGLFAAARKRPLPKMPRAIGIVTSPAAAALRDMVTTLARRMPGIPVILYPAAVQGQDAGAQVAAAIRRAGMRSEVDVLIVGRGGGSLEDLWAFNEEVVARAIAESPVPVVSGVGHETDFTIADFVADVRAATPTAAAELVSPNREEWLARLAQLQIRLRAQLERQLQQRMQRLDQLARRLQHPGEKLARQRDRLTMLGLRLERAPLRLLEARQHRLVRIGMRLEHQRPQLDARRERLQDRFERLGRGLAQLFARRRQRLDLLAARLAACNPQAPLEKGYALVCRADGELIGQAQALAAGDRIRIRFADDFVQARIESAPGQRQEALFPEQD